MYHTSPDIGRCIIVPDFYLQRSDTYKSFFTLTSRHVFSFLFYALILRKMEA
jgi:hypothetical protein